MITRAFKSHPESVGESYFEHLCCASGFGFRMLTGGFACIAHGLFPFLFTHAGSDCVEELHGELSSRRKIANGAEDDNCWSI